MILAGESMTVRLITHWEAKSISRETTFQKDIKDWQAIAKLWLNSQER